jgi:hypothetical protein
MTNLNNNSDYIDYIASQLDKILEWNDEAAKRISGTMYGNKLLIERKNKIKKIYVNRKRYNANFRFPAIIWN